MHDLSQSFGALPYELCSAISLARPKAGGLWWSRAGHHCLKSFDTTCLHDEVVDSLYFCRSKARTNCLAVRSRQQVRCRRRKELQGTTGCLADGGPAVSNAPRHVSNAWVLGGLLNPCKQCFPRQWNRDDFRLGPEFSENTLRELYGEHARQQEGEGQGCPRA